ncbi:hypothetical protein Pcinc_008647 [Petrolisthes cinctipes]|uniref:RNase H type-1 domain-containing protein n=1 Tax=Petrolisthes cinctipes TaxID=88211 RepID=A0AAE1G8V2_PETCI|nr:hypothetical protein Pcinc_008647 [Petrolisthes cinctipes]
MAPSRSFALHLLFRQEGISSSSSGSFPLLEHAFTHRESLPVYTDGSKSDAGVGFGVVFPDFCHGSRLPSVMSIFTAELSAILYALQVIFTLPQPSFTIFRDSCSALQACAILTLPIPWCWPFSSGLSSWVVVVTELHFVRSRLMWVLMGMSGLTPWLRLQSPVLGLVPGVIPFLQWTFNPP